MKTIFFLLVITAIIHYVYEMVILPLIRYRIRFRLFELRDNLIELKVEHDLSLSEELFSYTYDTINALIHYVPIINLAFLYRLIRTMRKDEKLRERMEFYNKLTKDCKIEEFHVLRKKLSLIAGRVLILNSLLLILVFIPIILIPWQATIISQYARKLSKVFSVEKIYSLITKMRKTISDPEELLIPEKELNRVFTTDSLILR